MGRKKIEKKIAWNVSSTKWNKSESTSFLGGLPLGTCIIVTRFPEQVNKSFASPHSCRQVEWTKYKTFYIHVYRSDSLSWATEKESTEKSGKGINFTGVY